MSALMNVSKNGKAVNRNSELRNWSNWIDDVFNTGHFPTVFSNNFETGVSTPKVNIKETKDDYFVEMAAPGLKKGDFNIDLENEVLTISAEQKQENNNTDENYTRREFSFTSFKRSFNLPEFINTDKIEAKYEDGVLNVKLPKREEAKPKPARTIKIK